MENHILLSLPWSLDGFVEDRLQKGWCSWDERFLGLEEPEDPQRNWFWAVCKEAWLCWSFHSF